MSKHGDWLRVIADEMRGVGASTMTPHELLAFYACEIEKAANSIDRDTALDGGECEDASTRFNAWICSECKATLLLMFDDFDEPTYSVDGVADVPRFCPNCGKAVKR